MTTEERCEKLKCELAAAKQINGWKLAVVALTVSLLCMVAKESFFMTTANAQLSSAQTKEYFVTGGADGASLWQICEDGKLQWVNRAVARKP